jgi:DNA-binding SARP family transcriptional activator
MIDIKLFGKLTVQDDSGGPIAITGAKTQGLLAYLALNTDMPPSRDRLMSLFWGDRFTDQARQSLRQAIAKLRRTLDGGDGDVIIADNDRVGLNPEFVRVDVDEFARLAASNTHADHAAATLLLSGPLLDGIYGQQADFEDWIVSERQRVTTMAGPAYENAISYHVQKSETDAAVALARRLISLDPLRDASQMILIRLLAQSGERAAAIQQFNGHEANLQRELGVGAGPELRKLISEVRTEGIVLPDVQAAAVEETAKPGETDGDGRISIAVVPFAAMAPGSSQEFFVDGLTQDITTNLSRFRWLDVRASLDLDGPRLTAKDMSVLGGELGLDFVVHGSLRTHGLNVRLTVQLAEPKTGRYIWVARYDRTCEDLFEIQDELTDMTAASVEAELERFVGKRTRDLEFAEMNAWDCYHRGLAIQYEFSAKTNIDAQRHFRRAIELDPGFAAAYARLSYAMVIGAIYFEAPDVPELLDAALEYAKTSCKLDPDDAVGRFALGRTYLARGEYERSVVELQTAIDLNPGMAQAHCGLGDSLAYSGSLDEAMARFEEAVRLSPADPYRWAFLSYGAMALLFKGDFVQAADWAAQAESVPNAHFWATAIRTSAFGHLGNEERAAAALADLQRRKPEVSISYIQERLFYLKDAEQMKIYLEGLRRAGLT